MGSTPPGAPVAWVHIRNPLQASTTKLPNSTAMKNIQLSAPFLPQTMSSTAIQELNQRLFKVHRQVFDGVTRVDLRRYVIDSQAEKKRIRFFVDLYGRDVGYITFQRFQISVGRKSHRIYRTEVCLLPAYRGKNATFRHLFRECAWDYIKGGFRRSWFVATPIHPIPYSVAVNSLYKMYPVPSQPLPQNVASIMEQMSTALGLKDVKGANSLVKKVNWIVRQNHGKKARYQASKQPAIQFYCRENPDYDQGNGLMILIPFSIMNGVWGLGKNLHRLVRRFRQTARKRMGAPKTMGNQSMT